MLIAMGVVLMRLQRFDDAEKCFKKAFQIGDVEGTALIQLGGCVLILKVEVRYSYLLQFVC